MSHYDASDNPAHIVYCYSSRTDSGKPRFAIQYDNAPDRLAQIHGLLTVIETMVLARLKLLSYSCPLFTPALNVLTRKLKSCFVLANREHRYVHF